MKNCKSTLVFQISSISKKTFIKTVFFLPLYLKLNFSVDFFSFYIDFFTSLFAPIAIGGHKQRSIRCFSTASHDLCNLDLWLNDLVHCMDVIDRNRSQCCFCQGTVRFRQVITMFTFWTSSNDGRSFGLFFMPPASSNDAGGI